MIEFQLFEILSQYGVLGMWLIVTLIKERTVNKKLIDALEGVKNSLLTHDLVVREKLKHIRNKD